MTEDQARQKWCPMVRIVFVGGLLTDNRANSAADGVGPQCIASDCMMWRWRDSKAGYGEPGSVQGECGLAK